MGLEQETFRKIDNDQETKVSFAEKRKIGEGRYGTVYQIEAVIGQDRPRKKQFVIKEYKDLPNASAQELVEKATKNYHLAKQAGLEVFPTIRVNKGGNKILMTDLNREGLICVGRSDEEASLIDRGREKLKQITNLEDLVRAITRQADIASDNNLFLFSDSYFFQVEGEAETADVIVGDFDEIRENHEETLLLKNYDNARSALQSFIAENIENPRDNWERARSLFYGSWR
jgi:hypothetical protein